MPVNQINMPNVGKPTQNVMMSNSGVNIAPNNQQMMAGNPMQAGAMMSNKPVVTAQQQPPQNQQQQPQSMGMNPQIKMQLQQQIRPQMAPGQPNQYQTKLVLVFYLFVSSLNKN